MSLISGPQKLRMAIRTAIVGVTFLGFVPVAQGEAVKMFGHFAAPYRDAALLGSLRIGRFTGDDGVPLSMAIERTLARPDIEGRTHFDLISGRRNADGVLSGHVTTSVQENRFQQKQKQCVEREQGRTNGKCVREEVVEQSCTRRIIQVNADLRLARHDGAVVYAVTRPARNEVSWCRGSTPARTAEEAIRGLITEVAEKVRADVVPRVEEYSVRFRETTRGLPAEFVRPFRDTVKLTQQDLGAACVAWAQMGEQVPRHPSITFDLALCAEAAGNWTDALSLYRHAAVLIGRGSNEGTAGAQRIEQLIAGRADDEARRGR